MEFKRHTHPVLDYFYIMMGTTLLAMSINMFYEPLELVIGGVTGLAIVVKVLTGGWIEGGVPIYITNIVINIPLFIGAIIIKGRDFGARSLFATFYLSFALFYTQQIPTLTSDILLGCIFGGILSGAGLGLVFSALSTTGGTDLMASLIQHFVRHMTVARIMFIIDGLIVAIGLFVFGPEKAMYAIVSIYISVQVIDNILEGINFSKAAFIISKHNEEIAQQILEILDRGVTGLEGEGKYTNKPREVLLCVVSKREIVKLKEIVRDIDLSAFVIVADVREVVGEGFIEYDHSKIASAK